MSTQTNLTIRVASHLDEPALTKLAALDSRSRVPAGMLLVAESDGEIRAAMSLEGEGHIANPFAPTAELVELLKARAALMTGSAKKSRFSLRRPATVARVA